MILTLNIKDVIGYPTPNAINASGVFITIDNTVFSTTNTASKTVIDNTLIQVIVTKAGYFPYSTAIQVFDYNMSIDIILVPINTDSGDPDYKKPYPFFHAYVSPCSFSVYVLNTSSAPYGEMVYFVDEVESTTSNRNPILNIGEQGIFNIRQNIKVTDNSNPVFFWDLNIDSNITVPEYRPELSVEVNTNADIEGTTMLSVVGVQVEIVPYYNMNNSSTCTIGEIKYTLFNSSEEEIDVETYVIDSNNLPNPEDIKYVYTPVEKGDYKLIVELKNCCTTTTINQIIGASEFVTLVSDGHMHTVYNLSVDKQIQVSLYDKDNSTPLDTHKYPVTVDPGSSYDVVVEKDGIYIIRILDILNNKFYSFIIYDYTDLRECLETIMKSVLCSEGGSCCDDCKENDKDILNKIIALGNLYFSFLQKEYGFNNIYESVSDGELQRMFKVDTVFTMLKKYCNCNVTTNTGGCSSC